MDPEEYHKEPQNSQQYDRDEHRNGHRDLDREDSEDENNTNETNPYVQPRIFEGDAQNPIPAGFDAITIHLDGRMRSDLDWKTARQNALLAIDSGLGVMWNIQLGLFDELTQPLTNQAQFLSLTLGLEHFRDTLWKEFKKYSVGLSLYRGSADFSEKFIWDEHQKQNLQQWLKEINHPAGDLIELKKSEIGRHLMRLFCRDVALEYLELLATRLPDNMPVYLFLNVSPFIRSLWAELHILNPERFERFHLALKGHLLPHHAIGWETPTSLGYSGFSLKELPEGNRVRIGICIPSTDMHQTEAYQELEKGIEALRRRRMPFKLIAECNLNSQWDELDYILCSPCGLSSSGKRMLQGFCAAGGAVVSVSSLSGFGHEMSLEDFLEITNNSNGRK